MSMALFQEQLHRLSRNANIKVTINSEAYDKKAIYLTDARRAGIMLRDSRLTLRDHSALTRFVVEAVGDNQFILQVPAMQNNNSYVFTANKGAFYAKASRDKAQRFQFEITELGLELFLEGDRPVVFDDYNDVSIGKFEKGRSNIPILIHEDISSIWLTPVQVQTTQRSWEVPMIRNQQSGGASTKDLPPWEIRELLVFIVSLEVEHCKYKANSTAHSVMLSTHKEKKSPHSS